MSEIKSLLSDYPETKVEFFINYIDKLKTEKDKHGKLKAWWAPQTKEKQWADLFKKVADAGLYIDGNDVTVQNKGGLLISFNYQAYKNLVLIKYPEAQFDMQIVKKGDVFDFRKESGKVIYVHQLADPFDESRKDSGNRKANTEIIGAYCIIKNRNGEFIETMGIEELEHIRTKAKTANIWNEWTSEMYLKTVIKRACKRHFRDITVKADQVDNETYDMEQNEPVHMITETQTDTIYKLLDENQERVKKFCESYEIENLGMLKKSDYDFAVARIKAANKKIEAQKGKK